MLSLASANMAFTAAPALAAHGAAPAVSMAADLNNMIGRYSVKGEIFDPLNLAEKFDLNWMREAEIKHGRVCMLAIVGMLTNDTPVLKNALFPQEAFKGISSIEAHDAMVKSGHMWALLGCVGVCELLHASVIVPKVDGNWGDHECGNYGLDPLGLDTPYRRESELKNGRLAMLAFSGLITQAALGATAPPYIL